MIDEKKLIKEIKLSNYHHASNSREEALLDRIIRIVKEQPQVQCIEFIPVKDELPDESEFRLEQLKVEDELKKFGGTRNMMDIGNRMTRKYRIDYCYYNDTLKISHCNTVSAGGTYHFKSREECLNAIEQIGEDRIKKYLFYVEGKEHE